MNQVHPLRWHDLPLVYRLIGHGASFDAQFSLTIGDDGLRHSILVKSATTQVYVLREEGGAMAVLRRPSGTLHAGLSYIAPALDTGDCQDRWRDLICGMSILAGQEGIVAIRAEVNDDSPELAVLREAEFATYAHQTLWQRPAAPILRTKSALRVANPREAASLVESLNMRAPALLRQVNMPVRIDAECYMLDGQCGMAAVHRGGRQVLIDLYLPPEAHDAARNMLAALMSLVNASANTITCRLQQDTDWAGSHLAESGFERLGSQAVMVRHTMAHIHQHVTKELSTGPRMALPTTETRAIEPTVSGVHEATSQPV